MKHAALWLVIALTLLVPGCGGGTGSSTTRSGVATFRIDWPQVSRLIPAAAASIKIEVMHNTKIIVTKVVPRPTTGGTTTVKVIGLPLETVTNVVSACPNADGSGVPQATGTAPLKILDDNSASITVTLDSTIVKLDLSPAGDRTVAIGANIVIAAIPRDAQGRQVLVKPGSLQWASSNPSVGTVDSSGRAIGLQVGETEITVTEPESQKKTSTTVNVADGGCQVPQNTTSPTFTWLDFPDTFYLGDTYTVRLQTHVTSFKIIQVGLSSSTLNWFIDGQPLPSGNLISFNDFRPTTHTIKFTLDSGSFGGCYMGVRAFDFRNSQDEIFSYAEVKPH
jgi:hypothetical protein